MTTIDQQITEQFGKIIKKFPILHHGWELDGYGYVVGNIGIWIQLKCLVTFFKIQNF